MFKDTRYSSVVYVLLFLFLFGYLFIPSISDNIHIAKNIFLDTILVLTFGLSFLGLERLSLLLAFVLEVLVLNISLLILQLHINSIKGDIVILDIKYFLNYLIIPFFLIGFLGLIKNKNIDRKVVVSPFYIIAFAVLITIFMQSLFYSNF